MEALIVLIISVVIYTAIYWIWVITIDSLSIPQTVGVGLVSVLLGFIFYYTTVYLLRKRRIGRKDD
ncbi:unnamed protein product [marine sediment metagenome]|uniref:Uncharacterized protein n=1 Tax=marine sediment metagenome TaxID=412755 RepID=X0VKN8_9ZZZZ